MKTVRRLTTDDLGTGRKSIQCEVRLPTKSPGGYQPLTSASRPRVEWVDGVRACAALYVLLHHVWLAVYPDFTVNTGPWYLGWLLYGHFGVVVFIVVSGYSLTLAPARNGMRLVGGNRVFARRRAWRILPPYWAALVLSMLVVTLVTAPRAGGDVTWKSLVVHGLLLQDVVPSPSPNGAFWSIAVEAQIYLLFPLLLLVHRRVRGVGVMTIVVASVSIAYLLAINVSFFGRINNLTPQLLVGFVLGQVAAGSKRVPTVRGRAVPLVPIAGGLALLLCFWFNRAGSREIVDQFFWVDIAVAAVVAVAFWGFTYGQGRAVRGLLASRPLTRLGLFSYSTYLVHVPIMFTLWLYVVRPLGLAPLSSFGLLLVLAVPAVLLLSRLFFQVFERPFLRSRSFGSLRSAITPLVRRVWNRPAAVVIAEPLAVEVTAESTEGTA